MSVGVIIELRNAERLRRALNAFTVDRELMDVVGATLVSQTVVRIQKEKASPEGEPWDEWSLGYVSRPHGSDTHAASVPHSTVSPAGGHSYLELFGHLRDSIMSESSSDSVEWGTNVVYGAVHQFGHGGVPPRPYLGISHDNEEELAGIIEDWFAEAAGGAT